MNAKQEFLTNVDGLKIKCASITYYNYEAEAKEKFDLKVGHTDQDYDKFLKGLDFEYDLDDTMYCGQQISGIVWFEDGTWMTREIYTTYYGEKECWTRVTCPEIYEKLI